MLAGIEGGEEDLFGRTPGTGAGECSDLTVLSTTTGDGNTCAPTWSGSILRNRLRNTRMPPGWEFDLAQTNRDTWAIESIQNWVEAGAPEGAF